MKMYFCKTEVPNFGDELNNWLWPKLLPDFFDDNDDTIFLGIGSILFDHFPTASKKIVFGAGYGGYTPLPILDDSWRIFFVRGLQTASALGLNPDTALGDAAILIRACVNTTVPKRFPISFMPHWETTLWGSWRDVCESSGIHYIDPTAPVTQIVDEIIATEKLVTEAMHGAIVADALRVPWIPVRPIRKSHRMKWSDWASALQLSLKPVELPPSNFHEHTVSIWENKRWVRRLARYKDLSRVNKDFYYRRAVDTLSGISKLSPQMSLDSVIDNVYAKMVMQLNLLRSEFQPDIRKP